MQEGSPLEVLFCIGLNFVLTTIPVWCGLAHACGAQGCISAVGDRDAS